MTTRHRVAAMLMGAWIAVPFAPAVAFAQADDGAAEIKQQADQLDAKLNQLFELPEAPAAFVLGGSTEAVARPGTLRELGAQLLSVMDGSGNLRPGLSVEVAPFEMLSAHASAPHLRDEGDLALMLESLRFSYATTGGPDSPQPEESPALFAVGFRIALVDQRDYRRNTTVRRIVATALEGALRDLPLCIEGDALSVLDADAVAQNAESCAKRERMLKEWRNDAQLQQALRELRDGWRVELAGAWALDTASTMGDDDSNQQRQTRFWLAAERSYQDLLSFGAAVDYSFVERDTLQIDGSRLDQERHSLRAGGRLGLSGSQAAFHAQGLYLGEDGDAIDWQHSVEAVISASARLSQTLSVQGSYVLSRNLTEEASEGRFIVTFSLGSVIAPMQLARDLQGSAE